MRDQVTAEQVASAPIRVEISDSRADVVIDRPEKHNALSTAMLVRLDDELLRLDDDPQVRIVVLRGAGGRAFSAGFDLSEASTRQRPSRVVRGRPAVTRPGDLPGFDALTTMSKPVVAMVDGFCLAGGFELAMLCDLRVATRQSSFGMTEARVGMLGGAGIVRLARLLPEGEALMMHMAGRRMSAERAFQVGLVQVIADDPGSLDKEVAALVADVLACSPIAVQFLKRIVREGREMTTDQQWRFAEMFSFVLGGTADAVEGPRAFVEKRQPSWTDTTLEAPAGIRRSDA